MAKIENTTVYPLTTPSVDDFVIGTDTSDENRTVSFSIESITATSLLQGLQSVLDTGNTATEDISLTGNITLVGGYIYPAQIFAAGAPGSAGQILSSTGTGIQWIAAAGAQDLQDVIAVDPNTTLDIVMDNSDINSTGSINMSGAAQVLALSTNTDMTLAAGCDITTSGNINLSGGSSVLNFGTTAEINDSAGSTGAIGSILTVDAAGTGVEWSTGIPSASMPTLQEVLDAGNTATGIGVQFIGSSITTFSASSTIQSLANNVWSGTNEFSGNGGTPATSGINLPGSLSDGVGTGTSGQVLTSTATGISWADLSTVGVSSVSTITPVVASTPSTPITISPNTGGVLIRQNIYSGGSLIGCVPDGGTAGTFLEGNGNWTTPTGAVTSVSVLASGTSVGVNDAIKITPTTGAVQVTANAFDGSDRVGHVPDSSAAAQTTTFLRADGTWQPPAGGGGSSAPRWSQYFKFYNGKLAVAPNEYMINAGYSTFGVANPGQNFIYSHGTSPPSTVAISDGELMENTYFGNAGDGVCATSFPKTGICEVDYQILLDHTCIVTIDVWKILDVGGLTYITPLASGNIAVTSGVLGTGSLTVGTGTNNQINAGERAIITFKSDLTFSNKTLSMGLTFRFQGEA